VGETQTAITANEDLPDTAIVAIADERIEPASSESAARKFSLASKSKLN
jgi:hypothetical protein